MNVMTLTKSRTSIFRVDRMTCPADHRLALEDRLAIIHGYFETLPGCLYNKVAIADGGETVHLVTIVEWESQKALADAKAKVAEFYGAIDFDPKAFMAERGIVAEFGTYAGLAI
ncbi:hypothetical protein [Ciceribacter ferrooxidans]|uniref:Antibiotic biosynthesis monooxygenase n=1 Tax=Ciceribacter ferrooxidans TaxID=2509717 RepID=A0A4Q2S578_9HYPH|nr:hypothetical protein [Ciceribacter ferrooxidans]RYB97028.1 hypothetical protein EUU22_23810 [Ciceribacter ferrooxidans]